MQHRIDGNWIAALKRFVAAPPALEVCELCAATLSGDHAHLIEPATQRLSCVCRACALLFPSHSFTTLRRVPETVQRLDGFAMTDADWDALGIPIELAFFRRRSTTAGVIATYPGPAGAIEFSPPAQAWSRLAARNPLLDDLEPDVEALLVNRVDGARESYRVPIDRCYLLVGLIRRHWRGPSGGTDVHQRIASYFAALREERTPSGDGRNA